MYLPFLQEEPAPILRLLWAKMSHYTVNLSDRESRVLLESLVKCLGLFLVTFVTSMAMPLEPAMDENSMSP